MDAVALTKFLFYFPSFLVLFFPLVFGVTYFALRKTIVSNLFIYAFEIMLPLLQIESAAILQTFLRRVITVQ